MIVLKKDLKTVFTLCGYLIVAGIMCVVCYSSIKILVNSAFTDVKGYGVYGTLEGLEDKEYLYSFVYDKGETNAEDDTKWAEYEKQGYTLEKYTERTTLSKRASAITSVVSQILCLIFVGSFIFSILLKRGSKEGNLVRIGAMKPNALKGLIVTLLACLPAFVTYIVFLISVVGNYEGFSVNLYAFLNVTYWPIFDLIFSSAKTVSDVGVWQLIACFLLQTIIPLMGAVSYYIGYKDYEFLSKLLYKKKRG